jgi:hypothetical protein
MKMTSSSLAEKVNVALSLSLSMSGPEWIVVIAGVMSPITHSYSAQARPVVPHWSVGRTAK